MPSILPVVTICCPGFPKESSTLVRVRTLYRQLSSGISIRSPSDDDYQYGCLRAPGADEFFRRGPANDPRAANRHSRPDRRDIACRCAARDGQPLSSVRRQGIRHAADRSHHRAHSDHERHARRNPATLAVEVRSQGCPTCSHRRIMAGLAGGSGTGACPGTRSFLVLRLGQTLHRPTVAH